MAKPSRIVNPLDLSRDGKQVGHLHLPHSVHRSAYGFIPIPIVHLANGRGPRVLLMSGDPSAASRDRPLNGGGTAWFQALDLAPPVSRACRSPKRPPRQAAAAIENAGGQVASAAEVRRALALRDRQP